MPDLDPPKPYPDDASYLADEAAYIAARCARIAAEREVRDGTPRRHPFADDDPAKRVAAPKQAEHEVRARLHGRAHANRQKGPQLGLDRLVAKHDLDDLERSIVLLCTMPCISISAAEPMGALAGFSFAV